MILAQALGLKPSRTGQAVVGRWGGGHHGLAGMQGEGVGYL